MSFSETWKTTKKEQTRDCNITVKIFKFKEVHSFRKNSLQLWSVEK